MGGPDASCAWAAAAPEDARRRAPERSTVDDRRTAGRSSRRDMIGDVMDGVSRIHPHPDAGEKVELGPFSAPERAFATKGLVARTGLREGEAGRFERASKRYDAGME
jgi:hypothetical protein